MSEIKYWLALLRTTGIGPVTFLKLKSKLNKISSLFISPQADLIKSNIDPNVIEKVRKTDWNIIAHDIAWLDKPNHHIVTIEDPDYPEQLKEIHAAPPLLFVIGNPHALKNPQIGIVGSRNPTLSGKRNAHDFAHHFAKTNWTITSGLAIGIDTEAHQGTLDASGQTIAVTGTGLDQIYPARNKQLAHKIIEQQGCIISEFPLGTQPQPKNFPRRNRIISGLSQGVLVVEATLKSGSLITAKYALEQCREVFAIPGSIHSPLSKGCHALIKQGAKLVETANDITEELQHVMLPANENIDHKTDQDHDTQSFTDEQNKILDVIGYDPVTVDQIINDSGITANQVNSLLVILELEGIVNCIDGGGYIRIR